MDLKVFDLAKPLIFASFLRCFWGPFPDPSRRGLFRFLARTRSPPLLVWSSLEPFWEPPGAQSGPLERPGSARKVKKNWSFELASASWCRPGRDLCSKGIPGVILIDFGTHLGDLRLDFRRNLGLKHPPNLFLSIVGLTWAL